MSTGFKLLSMGVRYENDRRAAFDESDRIDLDYVETYELECSTPKTSLAKWYEMQNDLTITLEIPKTDYRNPNVQNILKWADQPMEHPDWYRDLAVVVKMADD